MPYSVACGSTYLDRATYRQKHDPAVIDRLRKTFGDFYLVPEGGSNGPDQQASPLAARPYDLRHAAVSLWLNAGVPAPTVARRAGHSVEVLLRVYAACIDGEDELANTRISGALREHLGLRDRRVHPAYIPRLSADGGFRCIRLHKPAGHWPVCRGALFLIRAGLVLGERRVRDSNPRGLSPALAVFKIDP